MAVHIQEVLGQYVGPILAQYAQNDLGLDEAHAFKSVEKDSPPSKRLAKDIVPLDSPDSYSDIGLILTGVILPAP